MKTIPEQFEVGNKLVIQWDITYHESEKAIFAFLYLRLNNKDVRIASDILKLNKNGKKLLGDRANVFIELNRVIVTIHKLKYNDEFVFTCLTNAFTESERLKQNKTVSVNNVEQFTS